MIRRRSLLGLKSLEAVALTLGGCGKSESFRYRSTVEVETPRGLRTGSSVIEVRVEDLGDGLPVLPDASGTKAKIRREAEAVDIPRGKVLFALHSKPAFFGSGAAEFPYDALKPTRRKCDYAFIKRTRELKEMGRVGVLPAEMTLSPGMSATAVIRTGTRSIMSYLLSPIDVFRKEAGHKR